MEIHIREKCAACGGTGCTCQGAGCIETWISAKQLFDVLAAQK